MKYGIILAAGIGQRFGSELPKQFHDLNGKPVIIHTLEKFVFYNEKLEIVITIGKDYIDYANKIIDKYLGKYTSQINVVEGGKTRTESLINACNYIINNFEVNDNDIIITHDADRPFVTSRIIKENIEMLKYAYGVSTAIDTNNSILEVDNTNVVNVPIRKNMKIVQTPQTFRLKEFVENYNSLTKVEKESLIEATKSYVMRNKNVKIVKGEPFNIKITTQYDLEIAKAIIQKNIF